jgi:hypothetical protein
MRHFIITRFNVRFDEWNTTRDGQEVLTDTWLDHRFDIFNRYCLPSVKNQSSQSFTWCVFFDKQTPTKYTATIKRISESYTNFYPIFISGAGELTEAFKCFIRTHLDTHDEHIITTRLDNDDLIHKEFIATIQKLSGTIDRTVVDLRKGYQVNVSKDKFDIRKCNSLFNPFISLVESSTDFDTVISRQHRDWRDADSVVSCNQKRLWIQLVHDRNKLNSVNYSFPMTRRIQPSNFGLTFRLESNSSPLAMVSNNLKVGIRQGLRFCRRILGTLLRP